MQTITANQYQQMAKKPRRQPEGTEQRKFGSFLRNAYDADKLSEDLIFFTYSASGELKPMKTAVNQKQKGLRKGDPDYRFEINSGGIMRNIYIEMKSQKGSLTPEQKAFFAKHEGLQNAKCYIAKSAEEAVDILKQEGVYSG